VTIPQAVFRILKLQNLAARMPLPAANDSSTSPPGSSGNGAATSRSTGAAWPRFVCVPPEPRRQRRRARVAERERVGPSDLVRCSRKRWRTCQEPS
jgi:hypothetical protein